MPVNEMNGTGGNVETMSGTLKQMSRKELEALILEQVVQGIVNKSQAGKLQSEVLRLETRLDQMSEKVFAAEATAVALTTAFKRVTDFLQANEQTQEQMIRRFPKIRRCRTVGVQVGTPSIVDIPSSKNDETKEIVQSYEGKSIESIIMMELQKQIPNLKFNCSDEDLAKLNGMSPAQVEMVSLDNDKEQDMTPEGSSENKDNGNRESSDEEDDPQSNDLSITPVNAAVASPDTVRKVDSLSIESVEKGTKEQPKDTSIIESRQPEIQTVDKIASGINVVKKRTNAASPVNNNWTKICSSTGSTHQATQNDEPCPKKRYRSSTSTSPPAEAQNKDNTTFSSGAEQQTPNNVAQPSIPMLPETATDPAAQGLSLNELGPKLFLDLRPNANSETGVVLKWYFEPNSPHPMEIESYEIEASEEMSSGKMTRWASIGKPSAKALPMQCELSQLNRGHSYFFRIRYIDKEGRKGRFSDVATIVRE